MNETGKELDFDMEETSQELPKEDIKRISPSHIRGMVILYILWIVSKLTAGIVRQDTDGTSPYLLGAATVILLIGAAGLIYLEWRERKKR